MRVFGIDPGSVRTGYGCVDVTGSRYRVVACGAISTTAGAAFPDKLLIIHDELSTLLARARPTHVAVENVFHAHNSRSALILGQARGVALLAARQSGAEIAEYSPAEVKRAIVGYGRAEKQQVQRMVTLLLGLAEAPQPYDATDALAVAVCHVHHVRRAVQTRSVVSAASAKRSWRDMRVADLPVRRVSR